MNFLRRLSQAKGAFGSISPMQRCFDLAAKKQDESALTLVLQTRAATRHNRFASWDLQLQLLEAFLLLEREERAASQQALRGFFRQLRTETAYNEDEKAVLTRYGVSVLWLARGKQSDSCLLKIRHALSFDERKVRQLILQRFPNPDEAT